MSRGMPGHAAVYLPMPQRHREGVSVSSAVHLPVVSDCAARVNRPWSRPEDTPDSGYPLGLGSLAEVCRVCVRYGTRAGPRSQSRAGPPNPDLVRRHSPSSGPLGAGVCTWGESTTREVLQASLEPDEFLYSARSYTERSHHGRQRREERQKQDAETEDS